MKNILKIILLFFEYLALAFVAFYGMKYAYVAGAVFFGQPAGAIVASILVLLFVYHIIRKELGFKL